MTKFKLRAKARVTTPTVRQSPKRTALVTIVITNFNYARFLAESVQSVLTQRDVEIELVIVDDASTDESRLLAEELASSDPRIRLILRAANAGPVAAFNDGLEVASGEYVIRLDADDILTPGSVARAVALADQFPDVGLVYGHPLHFSSANPPSHRDKATAWTVWAGADWLEKRCRLAHNCITSPEVLMRASVLAEVGGMRALAHTHDFELWLRIARASDVGWIGGADQAWHRDHKDSLSAREVDVQRDLSERAAAFTTLFTDGEGTAAEDARLLAVARSALANEALTRTTQAYAAGRGESDETRRYLEFAEATYGTAGLPRSASLRRAQALGASRAPRSPYLLVRALAHRGELVVSKRRWRKTGV